ncbi:MAG TPA: UTP--glucose-1-phosphate uridylyltransferase [Candidatus Hydrogenedens sp.]|nr:UTP--glucose-1-phosphate uridylyltransferase [Candidatus Hydrogenedens sp.]HOL20586.1 UTP--glucose-1-phosphate uridylyltransferase [Candidatus Hydrogenedens sp.]HPP57641.1 UTP--glucose-1-phosphate uridylyltransferase [Candidatus Hydrogenedens sp.]
MNTQLIIAPEKEKEIRDNVFKFGQEHVFKFWENLNNSQRNHLINQLAKIDFELMANLANKWILTTPEPEVFSQIIPIPIIPLMDSENSKEREAYECGEETLRNGKVGLFLVAGGQGTRLGFDGPKGTYPIGPITGKSLFQYHVEKVINLQKKYNCDIPLYIMVSEWNKKETTAFFEKNNYFGLNPKNVYFPVQPMVPCLDETGKFILDSPYSIAMNPNGHGGTIQTIIEQDVIDDAKGRGVEILSYFQVDNWAVKVADPRFIGYHVLNNAEMSSKIIRKSDLREPVGVHCLCDGVYRVIEYSELDIYPQLLELDIDGSIKFFAGNPAMHIISLEFVKKVYNKFKDFPWHKAHKKIPYIDENGHLLKPSQPNGYKFETFIFDALRYTSHAPVAVEIGRLGEYTPIKQYDGKNSVVEARKSMNAFWGQWLEKAGYQIQNMMQNNETFFIEISPAFALTETEFIEKSKHYKWNISPSGIAIDKDGNSIAGTS